jgi:hypothetical protein
MRFLRISTVVAATALTLNCAGFPALDFHHSQRTPASAPAAVPEPEPGSTVSCAEFFDWLKAENPSGIEAVLKLVHKKRPGFLKHVVYAYQTRMPFDHGTFLHPRTIAYGGDARLVLNFGGRAGVKGYERMETMCFNDQENSFEFKDVVFPKEAASPEAISDLTAEEKLRPYAVIEGRGRRACTNCHQSPPRPIWNTSALWPGFYGAVDDALTDPSRVDFKPVYQTFESANWEHFQKKVADTGRYQYVEQQSRHPNAEFTLRLSELNGRRIVGELKRLDSAFTVRRRYEFAKALFCAPKATRRSFQQIQGGGVEETTFAVLPQNADAESKDIFLSNYYDEMQKERRLGAVLEPYGLPKPLPKERFEEVRAYYRRLFGDRDLNLDLRLSLVDVDEVMLVRELKRVTDKLDIDIESWSMVRDGGFVHENGTGGDGHPPALRQILEKPFSETFLSGDADVTAALSAGADGESKLCALLDKRVDNPSAASSAPATATPKTAAPAPPTVAPPPAAPASSPAAANSPASDEKWAR